MNISSDNRGFTLIETLVALAVLIVAIVPAYALSTSSVDIAFSIRNNMTAANLAQEGIEVIRALRDENWFKTRAFDFGLTTCAAGCRVQWKSAAVIALGTNPAFAINPTSGTYYYKDIEGDLGGTDSLFSRKVTITAVTAAQLKVESEVTWTERGRSKSMKVESHLFNWK